MRLRTGTRHDIDVILHHRRAMFRDMGEGKDDDLAEMERLSRQYLERAIPDGGYHAILAEDDSGEVIAGGGVVVVPWPGVPGAGQASRAWILNVYVEPEHRRKGIARAVMQKLVGWCRSQGFRSVSLHASEEGRPLYEQLGFRPANEMRLTLAGE